MNKFFKWAFVAVFIIIVLAAGFTFTVKEGTNAIVSRFGEIVNVCDDAGLHFKLPWPIDKVITYDTRSQYMDSGYTETMTNDKINIILQTYIVWNVNDAAKFYTSVNSYENAEKYLNDLVANTKNGVMGKYEMKSIVSTNLDDIKIDEIVNEIKDQVDEASQANYGIKIQSLNIKRLALPDANLQSVFSQMTADRQKIVSQYTSEGERDAGIIVAEGETEAAKIIAEGTVKAAEIDAETERQIAEIYGEAYDENSELFIFLKQLIALENSVDADDIIIMREDESPLGILTGGGIKAVESVANE